MHQDEAMRFDNGTTSHCIATPSSDWFIRPDTECPVTLILCACVFAFRAKRSWVSLVGRLDIAAACIGSTSMKAAREAGMEHIFYPEKPGLDGWTNAIMDAISHTRLGDAG